MCWIFKYYDSYDDDESEGDILYETDYLKLLDRYYRYGITFRDKDLYPKKRMLYENSDEMGIKFEDDNIFSELLYVKENFDQTPVYRYVLRNIYNLRQLIYNDVKKN